LVTGQNITLLSSIAFIILVLSVIPWRASQKILIHSAD
jgi:hypothetical protein